MNEEGFLTALLQDNSNLINSLGLDFSGGGGITKGNPANIGSQGGNQPAGSAGNVGILTGPLGTGATQADKDANTYDNRVKAENQPGVFQQYIDSFLNGLQTLGKEALIYGSFIILFGLLIYAFVSSRQE